MFKFTKLVRERGVSPIKYTFRKDRKSRISEEKLQCEALGPRTAVLTREFPAQHRPWVRDARAPQDHVRCPTGSGARTHLPQVNVNGVLEELGSLHAPLLDGEHTHGFDARFQLDHASVLVLQGKGGKEA